MSQVALRINFKGEKHKGKEGPIDQSVIVNVDEVIAMVLLSDPYEVIHNKLRPRYEKILLRYIRSYEELNRGLPKSVVIESIERADQI